MEPDDEYAARMDSHAKRKEAQVAEVMRLADEYVDLAKSAEYSNPEVCDYWERNPARKALEAAVRKLAGI